MSTGVYIVGSTVNKSAVKKKRNSELTKQAILASAREAFARLGYDNAGLREIASGAGVTAMLVNRYFGSKEGLFAEVLAESMATTTVVMPELLKRPIDFRKVTETLLGITRTKDTPLEGFQILLRSVPNERAAEIARIQIEKHHQKTLSDSLSGKLAQERTSTIFSVIAGFQLMRQMIGLTALADAKTEDLVTLIAPIFELLLSEPKDVE